jgi:endonuclease-3 related protein
MNQIKQIYNVLFKKYGPQHWWPVTTDNKEFEIIIGCILTQNTAWKNVEKAIANLKANDLISVEAIDKTSKEKLASLIKSSGYYNQKAERLLLITSFLKENCNAHLNKIPTPKLRQMLLEIKGVGNETADSILLYALNRPVFVVDAYTRRIFSRLGLIEENATYHEIQALFHKNLEPDAALFNEYHALLVEHAKRFCRKKPGCKDCPLKGLCRQNS